MFTQANLRRLIMLLCIQTAPSGWKFQNNEERLPLSIESVDAKFSQSDSHNNLELSSTSGHFINPAEEIAAVTGAPTCLATKVNNKLHSESQKAMY